MDRDNRSLDLGSSPLDASVADGLPVEAKVRARKAKHDEREQHSQLAPAGPGPWRDEHHALADATVTNARHRGHSAHVTTGAYVPVDVNHASLSAPVGVSIGAAATAGGAVAHEGASPWPLQADDLSSFVPTTGGATAAVVGTASPLSVGAGNGPGAASPTTESMTVTTDKADYAPGSTATFIVAGVNSGSSVAFQIADLASDPGINGIADVYAPFSVTDGGLGDFDSLANGVVVAKWQVPVDGSATGATLQLTATSGSQTATTTFSDASDTPGDYNSVFGIALNPNVPSEAPSFVTFQITALPTNGTVVLADGSTPVSVGQSLTPAQAAALRLKPNGVAQSSQVDFAQVIAGLPPIPRSITLPFDSTTNTITLGGTAAPASTTTTLNNAQLASAAAPANPNPIVLENQKPGTPQSVWQISPGQRFNKNPGIHNQYQYPCWRHCSVQNQ